MCAARKKKKEYVIGRFIVYINGKEVLKTDSFKDACALVDRSRRGAEALLYDSFLKTFDVQSMRSELCRRAGLVMESGEKRGFFRLHCVARKPLER